MFGSLAALFSTYLNCIFLNTLNASVSKIGGVPEKLAKEMGIASTCIIYTYYIVYN